MSCTLLEDKERGGDELRWLSRLREAGLHPVDYRALSWLPRCSTDDLGLGCALVRPSLGAGSLLSLMASFLFTRCLRGRLEGWAAEVESWAVAHGARPLSAVVQEVPRATASGLAYTLDPVTRRRAVVVQSVPGLHLALLTRGSPHDTFLLSPDGLRVEEVRAAQPSSRPLRHLVKRKEAMRERRLPAPRLSLTRAQPRPRSSVLHLGGHDRAL